jgi:hypothetical protein
LHATPNQRPHGAPRQIARAAKNGTTSSATRNHPQVAASWELRPSLAIVRASGGLTRRRRNARLLAEMRADLEELRETPHAHGG